MSDADDEGLDNETDKQVIVGICAMAKKSESKPMKEILTRLDDFDYIQTLVFPEETILKVLNCDDSEQELSMERTAFLICVLLSCSFQWKSGLFATA
jgi:hypothetical protein